ncbi:unnamed protein product [Allacma fusca]|uniref:Uncharacterized protein n=1 Tax=Allacma fusca TaxID=39272 RepID=A0A8J2PQ45_9HEXA|nr:unnamed protein product [Allacma fusca]
MNVAATSMSSSLNGNNVSVAHIAGMGGNPAPTCSSIGPSHGPRSNSPFICGYNHGDISGHGWSHMTGGEEDENDDDDDDDCPNYVVEPDPQMHHHPINATTRNILESSGWI